MWLMKKCFFLFLCICISVFIIHPGLISGNSSSYDEELTSKMENKGINRGQENTQNQNISIIKHFDQTEDSDNINVREIKKVELEILDGKKQQFKTIADSVGNRITQTAKANMNISDSNIGDKIKDCVNRVVNVGKQSIVIGMGTSTYGLATSYGRKNQSAFFKKMKGHAQQKAKIPGGLYSDALKEIIDLAPSKDDILKSAKAKARIPAGFYGDIVSLLAKYGKYFAENGMAFGLDRAFTPFGMSGDVISLINASIPSLLEGQNAIKSGDMEKTADIQYGISEAVMEMIAGSIPVGMGAKAMQLNKLLKGPKRRSILKKMVYQRRKHERRRIQNLLNQLKKHDARSYEHSWAVADLARRHARAMGMSIRKQKQIFKEALVHDIGKQKISKKLLTKSKLSPEEYDIMKTHSAHGVDILKKNRLKRYSSGAAGHHWRPNDPKKAYYVGKNVSQSAKMMGVSDAFDAMVMNRGYNKPKTVTEALAEIERFKGTQFDEKSADVFIKSMKEWTSKHGDDTFDYIRNIKKKYPSAYSRERWDTIMADLKEMKRIEAEMKKKEFIIRTERIRSGKKSDIKKVRQPSPHRRKKPLTPAEQIKKHKKEIKRLRELNKSMVHREKEREIIENIVNNEEVYTRSFEKEYLEADRLKGDTRVYFEKIASEMDTRFFRTHLIDNAGPGHKLVPLTYYDFMGAPYRHLDRVYPLSGRYLTPYHADDFINKVQKIDPPSFIRIDN